MLSLREDHCFPRQQPLGRARFTCPLKFPLVSFSPLSAPSLKSHPFVHSSTEGRRPRHAGPRSQRAHGLVGRQKQPTSCVLLGPPRSCHQDKFRHAGYSQGETPGKGKEDGWGEGRRAFTRCWVSHLGMERGRKEGGQEELRHSEIIPAGLMRSL